MLLHSALVKDVFDPSARWQQDCNAPMTHGAEEQMSDDEDETRPFSDFERSAARGEFPPGTLAGEYILEGFIARGGCGVVYGARHVRSGRPAAVKVLSEAVAHSRRVVDRFAREIDVLRSISHPNIVEIYGVGELNNYQPFYVMERLEGQTLDALIRSETRLTPRETLELMELVCAALAAAHTAGIVHRDVKASNIFICSGSPRTVKLLDFGIAKMMAPEEGSTWLTTAGRMPGTPSIMAPEQILGGPIDARVDVYALGVLLHRMLVGRLPFHTHDMDEMVRKHLEEQPLPPSSAGPAAHRARRGGAAVHGEAAGTSWRALASGLPLKAGATDEPQSFRDRRSRTRRHPVLYPPAGGRRRLRLRHAGAGRGSVLHHQDPDGHDGWPGATAREMQDLVAEPLEKRLQELTWYDRVGNDHAAGLCVHDGHAEGQHAAICCAGGVLPGAQEARR